MSNFTDMKEKRDRDNVIDACCYIALQCKNPTDKYEEQVRKLKDVFKASDEWVNMSEEAKTTGLAGLIANGNIEAGKCMVGNYMQGGDVRDMTAESFFKEDHDGSVYELLRNMTGDKNISIDNIPAEGKVAETYYW